MKVFERTVILVLTVLLGTVSVIAFVPQVGRVGVVQSTLGFQQQVGQQKVDDQSTDSGVSSPTTTQLFSSLATSWNRNRYDYDYDYPSTRYGSRLARDSYYSGYNNWDSNNRYNRRWNDNSYYSSNWNTRDYDRYNYNNNRGGYNRYSSYSNDYYPLTGSTSSYLMSDYNRNRDNYDYNGYGYGYGNGYYPSSYNSYNRYGRYGDYSYYNNNVNDQTVNDRYYYPTHNTYKRRNDGSDRWWNNNYRGSSYYNYLE